MPLGMDFDRFSSGFVGFPLASPWPWIPLAFPWSRTDLETHEKLPYEDYYCDDLRLLLRLLLRVLLRLLLLLLLLLPLLLVLLLRLPCSCYRRGEAPEG